MEIIISRMTARAVTWTGEVSAIVALLAFLLALWVALENQHTRLAKPFDSTDPISTEPNTMLLMSMKLPPASSLYSTALSDIVIASYTHSFVAVENKVF